MAILLRQGLRASKHATVSARALSVVPFDEAKQIAAAKEIDDRGRACGLKFYQCSWVDLFGVQRSKLVPAARISEIASGGAGFAGFAAHLDMDPTTGDLLAMPGGGARAAALAARSAGSPAISSTRAPSSRQRPAAVATFERLNIVTDAPGRLAHGPRNVLRSVLAKLEDRGLALKTGVECEFFLLGGEGPPAVADALDTQGKPCYDAHALMRRFDFIGELCEHMEALGWGPYQADHEDANGQFEINWDFDDALATADRVVFFKYMLRDALDALDGDAGLRAGLGDAFVDSDLKLRRAHWADYAATLSPFEFDHYLDC
ncbi:hypothetical protein JL721_6237 [Aureococcus anophagefferens]|nr:hypothetical protein JL721_6237 [Aureococcus anophagefferens]